MCYCECVSQLQAYFPKKPGNFAQHFLEICHGNRSRSGMGLLHIHMERAPRRFFFRKKVEVAKSHSFPIEITFFRRCAATPRSAEIFWRFGSHLRWFKRNLARFFLAGPLARAASKGTDSSQHTHTSVHMPSAHARLLLPPLLTSAPTEATARTREQPPQSTDGAP